jgi:hypothetical protein
MEVDAHLGSFESYLRQRLLRLEREGFSPEQLASVREPGAAITAALVEFRATRQALRDSGKFSAQGLQEAMSEAAARAEGQIRQAMTMRLAHVEENVRRQRAKLAQATADPTTELRRFWKKRELRTLYDRMGVTIVDPATGEITVDPILGSKLYREAVARKDTLAQEALEEWPLACPVEAELVSHGQALRRRSLDPVAAEHLQAFETLHEAMQRTLHDALGELRDYVPTPDPIADMAAGGRAPDAADEGA